MKSMFVRWTAAVAIVLGAAAPAVAGSSNAEAARAEAAKASFSLTIDLSDRKLYVMEGDDVVESYSVAVGQPRHPTPRGNFAARRIVWNPRWVPPNERWARNKKARAPGDPRNPMGRVKIFFSDPDYYIHGTRDVDSLGEAESHGCVRMRNSEVIALAKRVMANGGSPREPGWFRRVLNRASATREVHLSDPVPVRVRA
jgi:lipoprotein-anchoring transpeptidase ErfK/SrfK